MIVTTKNCKVSRTSWQKTYRIQCPACNALGIFGFVSGIVCQSEISVDDPSRDGASTLLHGTRQCPNTECGCIVTFWSFANDDSNLVTWPSARAAFNKEFVPTKVVDAFKEALECEANGLYVSSAIMLRKTMEEICGEQNAAGPNLKERIDALLAQGNISSRLRDSLHEIRYLGNDAAHLESTVFQKVGRGECNIAIKIVRETVRQLYQTGHLKNEIDALK